MEQKLSEKVIGCAIEVSRTLGHGFLERVYESALAIELNRSGITFERQKPIPVFYRSELVGDYICDFVIERKLIVEIKAMKTLASAHEAQVLNYLKATDFSVGLLLNFGNSKLGIRRLVRNHDDSNPF